MVITSKILNEGIVSALSLAGDDECFQRQQVRQFLLDTALQRMDNEVVSITFFAGWRCSILWVGPRVNSFSLVALVGAGYARKSGGAIQYAAHLIYPIEANPLWSKNG